MAESTNIAWCDSTFNPWIGCTKVSVGPQGACENCYAEVATPARSMHIKWGPGQPRHLTSASNWAQPWRWDREHKKFYDTHGRRQRVFCASLADVFDNEADPQWRADLFDLIGATQNLDWLLLTKRIGNVKGMLPPDWGTGYPNVWLLITVATQAEVNRDVPKLQDTPARIRGLSIEPQLGPISLSPLWRPEASAREDGGFTYADYPLEGKRSNGCGHYDVPKIDWIINGGESKQNGRCRSYCIEWGQTLAAESKAAGAAFFMKQLGHQAVRARGVLKYTGKGEDISEFPRDLQVRQFPNAL